MLEFGNRIEGVEYRERPGAYALILNNDKKIAVINRRGGHLLPGGGIEGKETSEECLRRECAEEIGCSINVGALLGKAACYEVSVKTNEPLKLIGDFYTAELINDDCIKIEEDHELLWLEPEEAIITMQIQSQSWAIGKLLELIKRRDK